MREPMETIHLPSKPSTSSALCRYFSEVVAAADDRC